MAQTIRPETAKLIPLGPRDIFDNGIQIKNLLLGYKFTVPKQAEYAFYFPQLSNYLYESPVDLFINVYQENKFILSTGSFPQRYFKKLEKGNYHITAQLRHKDDSFLETFKDLPIEIRWKLVSPISLDCYKSYKSAFKGNGKKVSKLTMRAGRNILCFFAPIPEDK